MPNLQYTNWPTPLALLKPENNRLVLSSGKLNYAHHDIRKTITQHIQNLTLSNYDPSKLEDEIWDKK